MSDCSTHAYDVPLKPCPFCSAEPEVFSDGRRTWGLVQHNEGCLFPVYPRHEIPESDFSAWNSRAAMEFDNWFYLPKPKEGIVDYGEPVITRTENGYKVRQIVDVVDEAARKWGDDLGDYVMRRICEVWNSRAERTCRIAEYDEAPFPVCSECGAVQPDDFTVYYCWNCGARVVS